MEVFKTIATIYLILGFIYAVFIATKKIDAWYWFPVNWVLGPLTVVYIFYLTVRGKRLPTDW